VKALVPVAVGVPEIRPVEADRATPAGRLPDEIDHVYGVVPPPACSELEYEVPFVPEPRLVVETVSVEGGAAAIAIESFTDWLCAAGLPPSLSNTVKLLVPVAVGVPEISPVAGARVRPAGRLPDEIDHVYGVVPPAACRRFE
jgi:hypothetical protein